MALQVIGCLVEHCFPTVLWCAVLFLILYINWCLCLGGKILFYYYYFFLKAPLTYFTIYFVSKPGFQNQPTKNYLSSNTGEWLLSYVSVHLLQTSHTGRDVGFSYLRDVSLLSFIVELLNLIKLQNAHLDNFFWWGDDPKGEFVVLKQWLLF